MVRGQHIIMVIVIVVIIIVVIVQVQPLDLISKIGEKGGKKNLSRHCVGGIWM